MQEATVCNPSSMRQRICSVVGANPSQNSSAHRQSDLQG
jgi:hypothetical protein